MPSKMLLHIPVVGAMLPGVRPPPTEAWHEIACELPAARTCFSARDDTARSREARDRGDDLRDARGATHHRVPWQSVGSEARSSVLLMVMDVFSDSWV